MTARRSHLIGVMTDIRNSFHAEMVEDIVEAADRAGYEVVLGARDGDPRRVEGDRHPARLPVRGSDSARSGISHRGLDAIGERLPTVVVGRRVTAASLDVVRAADGRGIGAIVDHLVGLGHRASCTCRAGRLDRGRPA